MKARRKSPSQRQLRVAKLIREALGEIFVMRRVELPELDVAGVSVMDVDVSPDLRHATVHVRPLLAARREGLAETLNAHAAEIRHAAAPALRGLKYMPRLHFSLDTAADHAARIDELLRQARKK